ncbi:putative orfan [Tupanvirus soda lake]|uniref:Orfan n=2 Tax=Tupanvirus TaxID=2094720 RepID=A0AC62AC47_9VIRU|nr:putative orfan [Tupanvirus soda lake]QKU35360.1 putative orfan [Tupanvirus soda lake]
MVSLFGGPPNKDNHAAPVGIEPTRPKDSGFQDRCIYHSAIAPIHCQSTVHSQWHLHNYM